MSLLSNYLTTQNKDSILQRKDRLLFVILAGFFLTNALIAEFIGVKIFALVETLDLSPFNWNLFGQSDSLNLSAGVLLLPVVFVMTDIINEYFGRRGIQILSFLAVALISYSFLMVYASIQLVLLLSLDYWTWHNTVELNRGGFPSWLFYFVGLQSVFAIVMLFFTKLYWRE
ncbi:MAG: VUT family protein [Chitinophagales bacterium]